MSDATKSAIVEYQDAVSSQNYDEIAASTQKLINAYKGDSGLSDEERQQLIDEANAW
jgi:hypothetical protein